MAGVLGCEVAFDRRLPPHVVAPVLKSHSQLAAMELTDPRRTEPLQGVRARTIEFGPGSTSKRTFKTEIDTNSKRVAFHDQVPEPGVTFCFIGTGQIWLDDVKLNEMVK